MESQSRYSIVERLTRQKLDIIDAKAELDGDIQDAEQGIENKEANLQSWNTDVEEDVKREKRTKEREIQVAKQNLEHLKSRKETKEGNYDTKIEEIDKALDALQRISEVAPTPQEQS